MGRFIPLALFGDFRLIVNNLRVQLTNEDLRRVRVISKRELAAACEAVQTAEAATMDAYLAADPQALKEAAAVFKSALDTAFGMGMEFVTTQISVRQSRRRLQGAADSALIDQLNAELHDPAGHSYNVFADVARWAAAHPEATSIPRSVRDFGRVALSHEAFERIANGTSPEELSIVRAAFGVQYRIASQLVIKDPSAIKGDPDVRVILELSLERSPFDAPAIGDPTRLLDGGPLLTAGSQFPRVATDLMLIAVADGGTDLARRLVDHHPTTWALALVRKGAELLVERNGTIGVDSNQLLNDVVTQPAAKLDAAVPQPVQAWLAPPTPGLN